MLYFGRGLPGHSQGDWGDSPWTHVNMSMYVYVCAHNSQERAEGSQTPTVPQVMTPENELVAQIEKEQDS